MTNILNSFLLYHFSPFISQWGWLKCLTVLLFISFWISSFFFLSALVPHLLTADSRSWKHHCSKRSDLRTAEIIQCPPNAAYLTLSRIVSGCLSAFMSPQLCVLRWSFFVVWVFVRYTFVVLIHYCALLNESSEPRRHKYSLLRCTNCSFVAQNFFIKF